MKENYYIGLVPEIASFVTGLEEVERLIGKGFVFHDAEIELVHLDRKARAATFRTWTWSAVDHSKHYYVDWRLDHCICIDMPDYEMNGASPFIWDMGFELDPDFPERITVYFNGTSVSAVCHHITLRVEEVEEVEEV